MKPSPEFIREHLSYDPESREFARRTGRYAGPAKQTTMANGYGCVSVCGEQFYAHHLAWVCVHGYWPTMIDHANRDRLDNRLCNLREATRSQNSANSSAQKSNKVGLRGVHFHKGMGKYRAQVCKDGRTQSLGYFESPLAAHAAYLRAAALAHGEFACSDPPPAARWP